MSTFTQFNGPPVMPSTKAVTELIDAYNGLSATLQKHIAESADAGVHTIKQYVDNAIADLAAITTVDSKIAALDLGNTYATKADVASDMLKKADATSLADTKTVLADVQTTATAAKSVADKLSTERGLMTDLDTTAQNTIVAAINEVNSLIKVHIANIADPKVKKAVVGTLEVTDNIITDTLSVCSRIDHIKWHKFTAQYAGTGAQTDTGTSGMYLLAMLSHNYDTTDMANDNIIRSKPGRLYLKVLNSESMNACIDFAVTVNRGGINGDTYAGNIQTVCSKADDTWPGLRFHLVHGTDGAGEPHVWLGLSCDKLPVGQNTGTLDCYASGINCIPVGMPQYKNASNIVHGIVYTEVATKGTGQTVTDEITVNTLYTNNVVDMHGGIIAEVKADLDADADGTGRKSYTLELAAGGASDGRGNKVKYRDVLFHTRPRVVLDVNGVTENHAVITTYEAEQITVPVGGILRWPATAHTLPPCFMRTDGTILAAGLYPDLAKVIPPDIDNCIKLPVETNSIIKVQAYSVADATKLPDLPQLMDYLALDARLKQEVKDREAGDLGHTIVANKVDDINARIDTEIQERTDADKQLDDLLDEERQARVDADTEERQARVDADTEAQLLISAANTRITKLHNGVHDSQKANKVILAPTSDPTATLTIASNVGGQLLMPFTLYTYTINGSTVVHANGEGTQGAWVGISLITAPEVTGFRYAMLDDKSKLIDWATELSNAIYPLEENVDGNGSKGVAFYIDKQLSDTKHIVVQLYDNADNYVYWITVDATGVIVQ